MALSKRISSRSSNLVKCNSLRVPKLPLPLLPLLWTRPQWGLHKPCGWHRWPSSPRDPAGAAVPRALFSLRVREEFSTTVGWSSGSHCFSEPEKVVCILVEGLSSSPHSWRIPLFPTAEAGRTERERDPSPCPVWDQESLSSRVSSSTPWPPSTLLSLPWGSAPSLYLLENKGGGSGPWGAPSSGSREGRVEFFPLVLMARKNVPSS